MIQSESILRVSDNSGAKQVKCIKVLGGFKHRSATLVNLIVVSVQKVKQHQRKKIKIKHGDVTKALIIRCNTKYRRLNSSIIECKENATVLVSTSNKPLATRVLGPVLKEVRATKFMKVASLASGLI